ncbi:MAG: LptF/LptG family permease [Candidatus Omnitrophota bacterium]
MRIIDKYILKSQVKLFIGAVGSFFFLYLIIDILGHLDDYIKLKVPFSLLKTYYLNFLPSIFIQTSPVACLLASLYTLGKLNKNNEIIAMRSAGLSFWQIAKPIFSFALILSVSIFYVNEKIVPSSERKNATIKMDLAAEKVNVSENTLKNLTLYGMDNRLFFINTFDFKKKRMEDIIILEEDNRQNVKSKIIAKEAVYRDGLWNFYQCFIYDFKKTSNPEPEFYQEHIINIAEKPEDFLKERARPELMNLIELNSYIWRLSQSNVPQVIRNLKVDLYHKILFPFTSLVLILIGIPFTFMTKKKVAVIASFGISLIIGFLYFAIDAISLALGKGKILPPLIAASFSYILFSFIGFKLIRKIP